MEIFSKERKTGVAYLKSNKSDTATEADLFELLSRVFFLNQEERFRAGIYIGYEGREWIEQAALILPTYDEDQISQ